MRLRCTRARIVRSVALLAVAGALLALPACSKREDKNNPVLARIGEAQITRWDFVSAVERAPRDTWPPFDSLDHAGRLEFLKTMIAKELLAQEAVRRFPTLPPDQEYSVRRAGTDVVLGLLAPELAPPERRLSKEAIEECQKQVSRMYQTHTLVLDNEARAKEVAAANWTLESFNSLVMQETLEMSLNETMSTNFLRDVTALQFVPDAIPALETVREGQVLGPFRGQKGWYVYRINAIAVPPDSALADTVGLSDACRQLRAANALWKKTNDLLEKAEIRYDDENVQWLQKAYTANFLAVHDSIRAKIMTYKLKLIPAVSGPDRDREMVRVRGEPITVGQMLDEMTPRPVTDYPNIRHRGSIRLLLEEIVLERVLMEEAEKRGITKRREVAQAVEDMRERAALSHFLDSDLMQQAKQRVTEDAVQKFYEENSAEYMDSGRIKMAILYIKDFNRGIEYTRLLKRGEPFAKVAAQARREDPDTEYIPDSGFFNGWMNKELYDFGRTLEKGTATGPVRMQDGRIVVYQVLDRTPPELVPLDLVRSVVADGVAFMAREQLLQELIPQLEKANAVQIFEDKL